LPDTTKIFKRTHLPYSALYVSTRSAETSVVASDRTALLMAQGQVVALAPWMLQTAVHCFRPRMLRPDDDIDVLHQSKQGK